MVLGRSPKAVARLKSGSGCNSQAAVNDDLVETTFYVDGDSRIGVTGSSAGRLAAWLSPVERPRT